MSYQVKQLKIDGHEIAMIPTSWKELTTAQVEAICRLSLTSVCEMSFRVQLFLIITGLHLLPERPITVGKGSQRRTLHKFRSKKTGPVLIASDDVNFVIKEFTFLFTILKGQPVIESKLVENHFPTLRNMWGRKLYGPDSALYNITLDEFIRAETLYAQMGTHPSSELFDKFAATLYRPRDKKARKDSPDFSGDQRQVFNDYLVERNARYTRSLKLWQKIYIRMFYDGCRAFIIHKHPNAFSGGGSGGSDHKTVFEGFVYLVTALSDNDATRAAKLRKTLLWDVLPQLETLSLQMKRLQEQSAKKIKY